MNFIILVSFPSIFAVLMLAQATMATSRDNNSSNNVENKCPLGNHYVRSPLSKNHCALNCQNYRDSFKACARNRSPPGCDPLPGFAFLNGQSGIAIPVGDCPKEGKS